MRETDRWASLHGLMFTTKLLVDGLYAGGHASPHRGAGVDFHDYRPYVPGDDVSAIDWKLYGRTDRYYLRRYQRRTDLHAYIMVDTSASMNFTGLDRRGMSLKNAPSKLACACELAAAIAMLTIRQNDRVGLGLFDKTLHLHLPPAGTWAHLQRIIHTLESARGTEGPGDLGRCIAHAHSTLRRRGLFVLISDLLDPPEILFDSLNRLRHDRFDVIVFQILTPQELNLREVGPRRMRFIDSETRKQTPTFIPQVDAAYRRLLNDHLATLKQGCAARNVDHNLVRTDESVIESLRRYLARRASA